MHQERYSEMDEASARAASGEPMSADPLIAKLPNISLRTLVCAALWIVLVIACGVGSNLAQEDAAAAANSGVWVEGTVQKIEPSSHKKNREYITIRYSSGGRSHTTTTDQTKGGAIKVGDTMTVMHAPGDPYDVLGVGGIAYVRGGFSEVAFPLGALSFAGVGVCLFAFALWRLRYRAVLRTGWRPAMATVRSGWLVHNIDVYLEDDYKLLRTRRSLRTPPRFKGLGKVPVLVGGDGDEMVVAFPHGRWLENRLYAVPAKEVEPDTD